MLSRLLCGRVASSSSSFAASMRQSVTRPSSSSSSTAGRTAFGGRRSTARRTRSLTDKLMSPATDSALSIGRGVVAGSAVVGIGALCYYGAGLSDQMGAVDRAALWPQYVRDRVRSSYLYFGGSLAVTAASAVTMMRSPVFMRLVSGNSMLAVGGTLAAMIGSGMLVRQLPYEPGNWVSSKHAAWLLHCSVLGAMIAPLTVLGGPLLLRAAWYTAGVVGGLSAVAVCAPSDKFLYMAGPLSIGLGVVFCASLGSMFLPAGSAMGAGLYSVSMYGGLVLFSLLLLYNTQRLIASAESHPVHFALPFDPINASVAIYVDTMNIFVRIAMMLAGGGSRKN